MKNNTFGMRREIMGLAAGFLSLPLLITLPAKAQTISGIVINQSVWDNLGAVSTPPGDGSGAGSIMVGVWRAPSPPIGTPLASTSVAYTATMPFPYLSEHPYALGPLAVSGEVSVVAWVDANADGLLQAGEPRSAALGLTIASDNVPNMNLLVTDDADGDGLPDWWEARWMGNLDSGGGGDDDRDGLTNREEFDASRRHPGLVMLNPLNWDSDGDKMDDKWELDYYAGGAGLNPMGNDAYDDADGDGLVNYYEYLGVDGKPRLEQDPNENTGVARSTGSADDLNPIDLDTDDDGLVDSFETAWYDPANGIDPKSAGNHAADPDRDGLTNYREQCLLTAFRQGAANDIWTEGRASFPKRSSNGMRIFVPPVQLGATNEASIFDDIWTLRNHKWTDPSTGSGYPDEQPVSGRDGWDTDRDLLPDGWEVEFNLDPQDGALFVWNGSAWIPNPNGFIGDPDGDGLVNAEEFMGQDGWRDPNDLYVRGSGDETNPHEHNWRPDSTPTNGTAVARPPYSRWWLAGHRADGTLGAALPTLSLGTDDGQDTDDDGLTDRLEIQQEYDERVPASSPVHSMDPFVRRSALITSLHGIRIPDPEGSSDYGYRPDLHARAWTLECSVLLAAPGRYGHLIRIPGPVNLEGYVDVTCQLSLSNGIPQVAFQTLGGKWYRVSGLPLPTNRWVHLSGVFQPADNTLALYVDGIFVQQDHVFEEGVSSWVYASATNPVLGLSEAAGPLTNAVWLDEVRIWNTARSPADIETYRSRLVPPATPGLVFYARFDDGGATAEDFTRKARSSLLRASDYLFGDHGYALSGGFALATNHFAPVIGVDDRGADDSDGDGLPDGWELVHHLDPFSAEGANGALGDVEPGQPDGLWNIYEYWSRTNPRADDSDQNGILDTEEDLDGDEVPNLLEQWLGGRPDIVDTDDDGQTDSQELMAGTNPADPLDPPVSRAMRFGGSAADYLEVPIGANQRCTAWSLEAWVRPHVLPTARAFVLRRAVQALSGGAFALNYVLGIQTNGVGGAVPFAGYVRPDGRAYLVAGGLIETGLWTHLAAAYSPETATLTLYTNGSLCAATNSFFLSPPINGKGGETFLRIGEDFSGELDEIRLWNMARNGTQIVAGRDGPVPTNSTGLIHYFRFDDGQATEDVMPFGFFHRPYGPQDFTHPEDWHTGWAHAARIIGNVQFVEPGAFLSPPSLRVTLLPAEARTAGAAWSVDGGPSNASGDTVPDLAPGPHTVTYMPVSGWTPPTNETVILTNGVNTAIVRTYLMNGRLRVAIEPAGARAAGAQWAVDGGPWLNSGTVASNLTVGLHTITFRTITHWLAPSPQAVTINENAETSLLIWYTEITGGIRAYIEPEAARVAGARWQVDGGPAQSSGALVTNLPLGSHLVSFTDIPPWITPAAVWVDLTNAAPVVLTGTYSQVTGLYVVIQPTNAVADGAMWRLAGGQFTNSGTLLVLAPGLYTVEFATVPGWAAPPSVTVGVTNDMTTIVEGLYYQYTVLALNGTNVGQVLKPRGMAFNSRRYLHVADSGNHRIHVLDPRTETWTVIGGPGTNAGQFNQPFGVAFDPWDNLYVADGNNHRVQRRDAQTGNWVSWGVYGTSNGQFIVPHRIVADAWTNLYVSDHFNHRVQKRDASGVWSTLIAPGFNAGYVRNPSGLAMDASNRLYVTDYAVLSTTTVSRVQQFATNGMFLGRIAGSGADEGGLNNPRDIKLGFETNLFIADMDNHRIVVGPLGTGQWTTVIGGDALRFPEGIAVSPRGYLYIADTGNDRVLKLAYSPTALSAPLVLSGVGSLPGTNGLVITWTGEENWLYAVQYTEDLLTTNGWTDLSGCVNLPGVAGPMSCTDTSYTGAVWRAYRVLAY